MRVSKNEGDNVSSMFGMRSTCRSCPNAPQTDRNRMTTEKQFYRRRYRNRLGEEMDIYTLTAPAVLCVPGQNIPLSFFNDFGVYVWEWRQNVCVCCGRSAFISIIYGKNYYDDVTMAKFFFYFFRWSIYTVDQGRMHLADFSAILRLRIQLDFFFVKCISSNRIIYREKFPLVFDKWPFLIRVYFRFAYFLWRNVWLGSTSSAIVQRCISHFLPNAN